MMLNERLSSPPKLVQEFPYNRRGECDRCPGRKQCMELVLAYGRHTAEPLVPCAYGPGYTRNWYIKLYGKIIFSEGWDTPRGFTIKDIMAKSGDGRGRAYDRLRRLMRKGYITAKKRSRRGMSPRPDLYFVTDKFRDFAVEMQVIDTVK